MTAIVYRLTLLLVLSNVALSPCFSQPIERPKTRDFESGELTQRIIEQKNRVVPTQKGDVEQYIEDTFRANERSPIDRGYNAPAEFHLWDQRIIDGEFDECWDPGFIYPCCLCPPFNIAPLTEYWWPVSKVENVDVPLKTGYLDKARVSQMKAQLESQFFPDKITEFGETNANRMIDIGNAYLARNNIPWQSTAGKIDLDPADTASLRNVSGLVQNAEYTASRTQKTTMSPNEFHTMPEPYGRNELYWSNPYVCHWNLDDGLGGARGSSPQGGQLRNSAAVPLNLDTIFFSDIPVGFEASRNAVVQNYGLTGRDKLRDNLGYDHWGGFFNGGFISEYMTKRDQDPFACIELDLGNAGKTPQDMLEPYWKPKNLSPRDRAQTGCFPKNMGEWVPTRNFAQTKYHPIAALVGTMRGLKLAYYYMPPDSYCKGRGMADSWGYCYNPMQHGGNFYDFEPEPYTLAFASHSRSGDAIFGPLAADKVQPSLSTELPNKCMTLLKYFDELERLAGADYPNKVDFSGDNPTNEKIDPHNTLIQWRFFRTCPKVSLGGGFLRYPGTNTAVCCPRCSCPFMGCCCPPDKRL